MSETNQPAEEPASDNPFETSEAASAQPSEPVATAVANAGDQPPEPGEGERKPTAAQAAAAWEEPQSTATTTPPESSKVTLLVFGIIFAIVVFLGIQNYQLRTKLSQLQSTLQPAPNASAQLSQAGGLKVISAVYGSGQKFSDVTDRVNDILSRPEYEFYARPEWLKTDPTPGWNKELVITFEYHGARHIFFTGEGGKVNEVLLLDATK